MTSIDVLARHAHIRSSRGSEFLAINDVSLFIPAFMPIAAIFFKLFTVKVESSVNARSVPFLKSSHIYLLQTYQILIRKAVVYAHEDTVN